MMPDKTRMRRRRYVPAPAPGPLVSLTPPKVQMLRYLAELRFLSLPQLARLCCPAARRDLSEKNARRYLRALFDAGLVDVLPVSRAALAPPDALNDATLLYGSAPNIYVPNAAGLKILSQMGLSLEEEARPPAPGYGPKNSLFLAHELAVRDVRVWLEQSVRQDGCRLERWRDGEAATIGLDQPGVPRVVRPDAWFALRLGLAEKQTVLVGLVEVDRGTERGERHWREKLAAYGALYAGNGLRATTGYVNARILVITLNPRRGEWLLNMVQEYGGKIAGRVWVTLRSALDESVLGQPLWRKADDRDPQPLVQ